MLAAALENPDNGETFYYVFDEASRMRTKECIEVGNGLTYGVSYEPLFETGEAVHYDSLEAAAEALNLPNLVQTIETNNEHSRKGEEDESGRANLPLIDDRDGVYLLRVIPTYYLTTRRPGPQTRTAASCGRTARLFPASMARATCWARSRRRTASPMAWALTPP